MVEVNLLVLHRRRLQSPPLHHGAKKAIPLARTMHCEINSWEGVFTAQAWIQNKHTGAYLLTLQQCFPKCEMDISCGICPQYGYVEGCACCIITCMTGGPGSMLMEVEYWMYLLLRAPRPYWRRKYTVQRREGTYKGCSGRQEKSAMDQSLHHKWPILLNSLQAV